MLRIVALLNGQKEAAYALGLSIQTLKNHVTSIYAKLSTEQEPVTSQTEALVAVGWLRIPDEAGRTLHHDAVALAKVRAEIRRLMDEATDIAADLAETLAEE